MTRASLDEASRVRLRHTVQRAIDQATRMAAPAPRTTPDKPAWHCRVPTTIRLLGLPDEDGWQRLEEALVRKYTAVVRRAAYGAGAGTAEPTPFGAPIRERYDESRLRPEGYLVPGYDQEGDPIAIPEPDWGIPTTQELIGYTQAELREAIRDAFPATGGVPAGGLFYGIYARIRDSSSPALWYLRTSSGELASLFIYVRKGAYKVASRLEPGYYTLTARPGSTAKLTHKGQAGRRLDNPEKREINVAFVVQPRHATQSDRPQYSLIPVVHILAQNVDSPLGTGAVSIYTASVDVLGVDEHWRPRNVSPGAFVVTVPHFRWEIYRMPRKDARRQQPELLKVIQGEDKRQIRRKWKEAGTYEVVCIVTVRGTGVAPVPVSDRRQERVIGYRQKIALVLELNEKQQAEGKPIWATSARLAIQKVEHDLAIERGKPSPNEAKIDMLVDMLDELKEQLDVGGSGTIGPFPVHAVFADLKTTQVRPIQLFLAFEPTGDLDDRWRCYLIDTTYKAFYRTYTGEGRTVREALLAAMRDSEEKFRRTYPPGHILVRVSKADLESNGITALTGFTGSDFTFKTDSLRKDAYEWLTLGITLVGLAAMVASFVFPPSGALFAVLVVTSVAGAALSVANIAERIATDSFSWDVETFSDLAAIAGSLAQVGSVAGGVRATKLSTALETAVAVPADVVDKLTASLKFANNIQRALMFTQLGVDVASAVIVGADIHQQLEQIKAEFDDASLADYQRAFGKSAGLARWREDRENRISAIWAYGLVNGTVLAVSYRNGTGLGKLPDTTLPITAHGDAGSAIPGGTSPHAPTDPTPAAPAPAPPPDLPPAPTPASAPRPTPDAPPAPRPDAPASPPPRPGTKPPATPPGADQPEQGRPRTRITLHHGTDQRGFKGLGRLAPVIDVARAPGAHQDLGQGFYMTTDVPTAQAYAEARGSQRDRGLRHVLAFEVDMADLGTVVDIRPGGNFRAQWDAFLKLPPYEGAQHIKGMKSNEEYLRGLGVERRGVKFDEFLASIGMTHADTIIAPLGDNVFTGITSGQQAVQVNIRSQDVADRITRHDDFSDVRAELGPEPAGLPSFAGPGYDDIGNRLRAAAPDRERGNARAAVEIHVPGYPGPTSMTEASGVPGVTRPVRQTEVSAPERHVLAPFEVGRPPEAGPPTENRGLRDGADQPLTGAELRAYAETQRLPNEPSGGYGPHPFSRAHDAETKLLERISAQLPPNATGAVHIKASHPWCGSCIEAIHRFRGRHPGVQVVVHMGTPQTGTPQ